jgi:hypothetical protein
MKNYLPDNHTQRKWIAIAITILITIPLGLLSIYGMGTYGMALFLLLPSAIGMIPVLIYGQKKQVSRKEAFLTGLVTLLIFCLVLIACAIEGLICIVMVSPLAIFFTWLGGAVGRNLVNKKPYSSVAVILLLICTIPAMSFIEKDTEPELTSVTTSIEIMASPEMVWQNVIAFPSIGEPYEWIFKTGIAYPTDARIEGRGVGAVRHCNFTTGSFVEPITVWDEPHLLKFSVEEQPAPMRELSFWDINAPHLHDYFVSKQGQFKLTPLPNGNTLLEGTTWYYHDIRPAFYWRPWSSYIIHAIHTRVLRHIKENAQKG